ncbi:putative microtubule-associated protein, MAP65/Ase1/PRC1 [Medicago truncatula]|uniref:Microtubule associated protein, MAP65/ASE1 family protein n=1 Tax=Medicago truncatula TaxID=3880 RepID=G7L972_MEDTR|nr:65-kDa microtubule-associated protein 5 [Medicago truncatula]AET01926.1 microtubule associated protein, MAP65/ASE1 family protein [Medicago truncatula]RHN39569.1 putative microtubule-associated protein, MAP65/Ase1/PRC1 [Medicago truncatula]
MASTHPFLSPSGTTRGDSLLHQLQAIWDETGEWSDTDRDNMLLQIEQEYSEIYHRKVEDTIKHKDYLNKVLDDFQSEIANIASSLGEDYVSFSRGKGTLKQQLANIIPVVEDLRFKKKERVKEILEIKSQISQIRAEKAGCGQSKGVTDQDVDQCDLTMEKLGKLKSHLNELQNEKNIRHQKVKSHISTISELSAVMSIDISEILNGIHPSLNDSSNGAQQSISDETLARLNESVLLLKQEKQQSLQKVQFLEELWDFMGITTDEQKAVCDDVIGLISASVDEVSIHGSLSNDIVKQVDVEVQRLQVLNPSKMKEFVFKRQKELAFKRQNELEEIHRGAHMDMDAKAARQILTDLIGNIDMSELLQGMDKQIRKAKEQAQSRRDIIDRVAEWKSAAEEEKWLDEYERRAEKARILVTQIPSMVENLTTKVKTWETNEEKSFLYEKVPLLNSLHEYNVQRQLREEEKRKSREQKQVNEQLAVEQEAVSGSGSATKKPSEPEHSC